MKKIIAALLLVGPGLLTQAYAAENNLAHQSLSLIHI